MNSVTLIDKFAFSLGHEWGWELINQRQGAIDKKEHNGFYLQIDLQVFVLLVLLIIPFTELQILKGLLVFRVKS